LRSLSLARPVGTGSTLSFEAAPTTALSAVSAASAAATNETNETTVTVQVDGKTATSDLINSETTATAQSNSETEVTIPLTSEAAATTKTQTRHRSAGRNDDDGIRSRHASRGRPKMVNFY
jgi:hypothetical protein